MNPNYFIQYLKAVRKPDPTENMFNPDRQEFFVGDRIRMIMEPKIGTVIEVINPDFAAQFVEWHYRIKWDNESPKTPQQMRQSTIEKLSD